MTAGGTSSPLTSSAHFGFGADKRLQSVDVEVDDGTYHLYGGRKSTSHTEQVTMVENHIDFEDVQHNCVRYLGTGLYCGPKLIALLVTGI